MENNIQKESSKTPNTINLTKKQKNMFKATTLTLLLSLLFVGVGGNQVSAETELDVPEEATEIVEIYTAKDLQAIESHPEKENPDVAFVLMNDIDCSSIEDFDSIDYFGAQFDGAGHTISNYNSTTSGLFYDTSYSAYIHDVTIQGNVDSQDDFVGGLVGDNYGTVDNACSEVNVNGSEYVGGLVGYNESGTINNSYAAGNVSGYIAGGLAGYNEDGDISNSYAEGEVNGTLDAGGLVGENDGDITNSYATGSVEGDITGGLVGDNYGTIHTSNASGNVSGESEVGGLAGWSEGTITKSYATGDVEGYYSGGLVGYNFEGGEISDSYATGSVTSTGRMNDAGGLVGENDGSISKSYATGNAQGNYVGGLVGYNGRTGVISNSYATGSVTGTGLLSSKGGLIGESIGEVKNCYAYEHQMIDRSLVSDRTSRYATGIATYEQVSSVDWHQDTLSMGDQFVYTDGEYPQLIDDVTGTAIPGQTTVPVDDKPAEETQSEERDKIFNL